MGEEAPAKPHYLYRLFDADGVLLYIGITKDVEQRMRTHKSHPRSRLWWPRVARRMVVAYRDVDAADAAETQAIRSERPLMNKMKLEGAKPATARRRISVRGADSVSELLNEMPVRDVLRRVAKDQGWSYEEQRGAVRITARGQFFVCRVPESERDLKLAIPSLQRLSPWVAWQYPPMAS